jgi:predicted ATP-grasp superfamily ATP-dependent carboligase
MGDCIASKFGLQGWFGIDFVLENEQVWLLEVNPRFTASMELLDGRACKSIFASHLAAFDFPPVETSGETIAGLRLNRNPVAAKLTLFNDSEEGLLFDSRQSDLLWSMSQKKESPVCDVPRADWTVLPGSPLCTIRSEGDSSDEVLGQLEQTKKAVTSIVK